MVILTCNSTKKCHKTLAINYFGAVYLIDCINIGETALKSMANEKLVEGFSYDSSNKLSFCEPCAYAKNHRTTFPKNETRRHPEILDLVHSDVCGKLDTKSLGGAEYFLTFIDYKSRYTWVYFLSSKDQVFAKFVEWKTNVELSTGQKVKTLRTDNGGEYTSKQFDTYLKKEGVRHELTIPKTPEQNGVAERMNRTLIEMTRAMIYEMPHKFWAEAVNTAVYLKNRSPTAAIPGMTPYEALKGEKPDVSDLKSFGCDCYVHVPKDERRKLDSKSRKCMFMGYGECVKGFRVYDTQKVKIMHSRDVIFNEKPGELMKDNSEPVAVMRPELVEEPVDIPELVDENVDWSRPS